jgi:ribosomal protein S18 acetylase RimI-like enzyme
MTSSAIIRDYTAGDESGAYYVCMKTGNFGGDGEPFYRDDPDALGRIYVGPYLKFAPEYSLILEDHLGVAGYALGTLESREFFDRYEREWRPDLCRDFPDPSGDESEWSRVESVYHLYHHPDYTCPEPYALYPSHLHIDLLPRAQGHGYGRAMMEQLMDRLRQSGSPGVHLGMSAVNDRAYGFYRNMGFHELMREGEGTAGSIYMGYRFAT